MKAIVKTMYAQVKPEKKEDPFLQELIKDDKKRFDRRYQEYLKRFKKIK